MIKIRKQSRATFQPRKNRFLQFRRQSYRDLFFERSSDDVAQFRKLHIGKTLIEWGHWKQTEKGPYNTDYGQILLKDPIRVSATEHNKDVVLMCEQCKHKAPHRAYVGFDDNGELWKGIHCERCGNAIAVPAFDLGEDDEV